MDYHNIEDLEIKLEILEERIYNASILLADWDGYYNPKNKKGNAEELARLIEEAYIILQGKSWKEN
jgi:hypothetical protein